MRERRIKAAVLQWFIPTCALAIIIVAMLYHYSVESSRLVAKDVDGMFADAACGYADRMGYELVRMSDAGKPFGYLMKGYIGSDKRFMAEMAEALCYNTEAYEVIYTHGKEGFRHDGSRLAVTELPYFAEIEDAMAETEANPSGDVAVRYVYAENDGLETGRKAIVAVISVDGRTEGDALLMYYPTELLQGIFKEKSYDGHCFFAVMRKNGDIVEKAGVQSAFLEGGNLWETLRKAGGYDTVIADAALHMESRSGGSFHAEIEGESRVCFFAPAGFGGWSVVIGINQSYVDCVRNREWKSTKEMVWQLLAAVFVFFGLVMVLNIFNKIKSGQENRKLEEKADTDLLTNLNNKLATERKIEEYIEKEQGGEAVLFIMDIDDFKKINDTMGHAFGDEVLRTFGHSIKSIFRSSDIIGRVGGDEFIIFLKNLDGTEAMEKEAAKLADFFKHFKAGEYVKYAATASIGAASFPKDGRDFKTLYKAADSALYVAKKRGKKQLAFYGEETSKSEGMKRVEAESRIGD